jgi:hypothetical protein
MVSISDLLLFYVSGRQSVMTTEISGGLLSGEDQMPEAGVGSAFDYAIHHISNV